MIISEVVYTTNHNDRGEVCITASSPGGGRWYQSMWIPGSLALGYFRTVEAMLQAIRDKEPYRTRYYTKMVHRLAVTIFPFFRANDEWPLTPASTE